MSRMTGLLINNIKQYMISQSNFFIKLRTSNQYFYFIIFQSILSLIILLLAIFNHQHMHHPILIILQFFLTCTITFDLILKYKSQQTSFFCKIRNICDLLLLFILVFLQIVLIFTKSSQNNENSFGIFDPEIDDEVTVGFIMGRYITQIIRMVSLLRKSHENIKMQKNLKQIDFGANLGDKSQRSEQDVDKIKEHIVNNLKQVQSNENLSIQIK